MLGSPLSGTREPKPVSSTPPKSRPEPAAAKSASTSRYAKPKVLMGEVVGPRGPEIGKGEIGKQRDTFRAFMIARHLRPTEWARAAGVPAGELLGFLTGKARSIAPATLEKLARAARCTTEDFFR
jgi:hypothetical protein